MVNYSWFATTWQGGHIGGQYNRIFSWRICMKMAFSSQRREMLLFLITNMANMDISITYHFLADLHITKHAIHTVLNQYRTSKGILRNRFSVSKISKIEWNTRDDWSRFLDVHVFNAYFISDWDNMQDWCPGQHGPKADCVPLN